MNSNPGRFSGYSFKMLAYVLRQPYTNLNVYGVFYAADIDVDKQVRHPIIGHGVGQISVEFDWQSAK